jgi:hypothetical protein
MKTASPIKLLKSCYHMKIGWDECIKLKIVAFPSFTWHKWALVHASLCHLCPIKLMRGRGCWSASSTVAKARTCSLLGHCGHGCRGTAAMVAETRCWLDHHRVASAPIRPGVWGTRDRKVEKIRRSSFLSGMWICFAKQITKTAFVSLVEFAHSADVIIQLHY